MRSLVNLFKALSDETRLRILNLLLEGELCVCEVMDALQMPQPRISHQLRILKDAGLVTDRREGKWMIYALKAAGEEEPASALLQLLWEGRAGEIFARDRGRLQETFAKRLRACGRAEASTPEEEGDLAERAGRVKR
jgi:ArsR family transcriptional regulator